MPSLVSSMFHPAYSLKLRKTRSAFLFHYLWLIEIGVAFLFSWLEGSAEYCKAGVVSSQIRLDFHAGLPCWVWEWQLSTARDVVTWKCVTAAPWGNNQLPASKSKGRYLVTGECKLIIHSLYRESKHALLLSWFEVPSSWEASTCLGMCRSTKVLWQVLIYLWTSGWWFIKAPPRVWRITS